MIVDKITSLVSTKNLFSLSVIADSDPQSLREVVVNEIADQVRNDARKVVISNRRNQTNRVTH